MGKGPSTPRGFTHDNKPQPKISSNITNKLIDQRPSWRFSKFDWNWEFCLKNQKSDVIISVLDKLGHFESMTWQEIIRTGSHPISLDKVIKPVKNRFIEKKLDKMADELYSLRLKGTERLWGIIIADRFYVLWYDPKHSICPSKKSHT